MAPVTTACGPSPPAMSAIPSVSRKYAQAGRVKPREFHGDEVALWKASHPRAPHYLRADFFMWRTRGRCPTSLSMASGLPHCAGSLVARTPCQRNISWLKNIDAGYCPLRKHAKWIMELLDIQARGKTARLRNFGKTKGHTGGVPRNKGTRWMTLIPKHVCISSCSMCRASPVYDRLSKLFPRTSRLKQRTEATKPNQTKTTQNKTAVPNSSQKGFWAVFRGIPPHAAPTHIAHSGYGACTTYDKSHATRCHHASPIT